MEYVGRSSHLCRHGLSSSSSSSSRHCHWQSRQSQNGWEHYQAINAELIEIELDAASVALANWKMKMRKMRKQRDVVQDRERRSRIVFLVQVLIEVEVDDDFNDDVKEI